MGVIVGESWPAFAETKEVATMPISPANQTGAAERVETVENKFRRLGSAWRAETAYVSSSSDLVAHSAFQEIARMGPAVFPLLLCELENRIGYAHRTLRLISGADPVPPADRGKMGKAAEA